MDERMDEPVVEPVTPRRRRRFSRVLLAAVVVSMALLGAAVVHENAARHDRRVAVALHSRAESRLADEQKDAKAAESRLEPGPERSEGVARAARPTARQLRAARSPRG